MFVQGLHDIFQNIKGKTYVLLWAKNNKVLTENWRALSRESFKKARQSYTSKIKVVSLCE